MISAFFRKNRLISLTCLALAFILLACSFGLPGSARDTGRAFAEETETDSGESTDPVKDESSMPADYTGFWTDGKYYINGVLQTGWRTIGTNKYYFDGSGNRVTGKRKIGKHSYYFNESGILKKGRVTTARVIYFTNKKSGAIYGMRLRAKVICQRPKLPTGCEIVSWTMMANYAGVKISKLRAANIMPRSGNPNKGFVGSPYRSKGGALVVYPPGLMKITRRYLGKAVNMTGCSLGRLQSKIASGHVVVAWVRPLDGFTSHTIAVTGYDTKRIYYNDPWTGRAHSMTKKRFNKLWRSHRRRALSW